MLHHLYLSLFDPTHRHIHELITLNAEVTLDDFIAVCALALVQFVFVSGGCDNQSL